MIGVAIALVVLGIIGLFVFPWGGIALVLVGLVLLVLFLLGIGRRAARHRSSTAGSGRRSALPFRVPRWRVFPCSHASAGTAATTRSPRAWPSGGPATARRAAPTPGALRRERRALLKAREERIRDLGGLMLEMYRRDHYREELVFEQCAELVALEERILELDALVAASAAGRPAVSRRCSCGAPLYGGVHFCANCGRPAGDAVVGCERCGHPLPADAQFCAACGAPAGGADAGGAYDGDESNGADPAAPEAERALDPWER